MLIQSIFILNFSSFSRPNIPNYYKYTSVILKHYTAVQHWKLKTNNHHFMGRNIENINYVFRLTKPSSGILKGTLKGQYLIIQESFDLSVMQSCSARVSEWKWPWMSIILPLNIWNHSVHRPTLTVWIKSVALEAYNAFIPPNIFNACNLHSVCICSC